MGDFGQEGPANLWKSGPLFSTGDKEAELRGSRVPVEPAFPGEAIERIASLAK
jgi:hypothetical protein